MIENPDLPRVWLLLGDKTGDNAQVLALGRALNWSARIKQLKYDPACRIPYRKRKSSLIGLDLEASDALTPPWPDIIIGIGQRSAPVARWIARRTSGQALNIRLGRPRSRLGRFDLVASTPQYGLPAAPNVMHLSLPFTLHDPDLLARAGRNWQDRFADLPRPWTAILLGGKSSGLRFTRGTMTSLLEAMERHRSWHGGSFLISTSPRTPPPLADYVAEEMATRWSPESCFFHRWSADASNPYAAFLARADMFVVTNDSVSMIADVAATGRPFFVHELPAKDVKPKHGLMRYARRWVQARIARRQSAGWSPGWIDPLLDRLVRAGVLRPNRNIDAVFAHLRQQGTCSRFGQDRTGSVDLANLMAAERAALVARIQALVLAKADGQPVPESKIDPAPAGSVLSA